MEKAYSGNRLFLEHNRPYWRELRPLATPWAWCIKEGTDPWKGQKRALLSHVQVSQLPLSLLSPSLALLYFYGFIIIIVVIIFSYVYLLVKGYMTVTNKPGHKYSKSLRYKPRHINSKDTLTLSLSLFLVAIVYGQAISHIQYSQLGLLHYRGAGYLTFIILTASLSLSPQMAIEYGQAISHIQYSQLGSLHYRGAGYLTFIILTASLSPPKWPLYMGRLSPISNTASWASCIIRVQAISLL